MISATIIQGL